MKFNSPKIQHQMTIFIIRIILNNSTLNVLKKVCCITSFQYSFPVTFFRKGWLAVSSRCLCRLPSFQSKTFSWPESSRRNAALRSSTFPDFTRNGSTRATRPSTSSWRTTSFRTSRNSFNKSSTEGREIIAPGIRKGSFDGGDCCSRL